MKSEHTAFRVIALVMILVSAVGVVSGLALTASMIGNMPKTEVYYTSAGDILECRSLCVDMCIHFDKEFEHGRLYESGECECFCV